MKKHDPVEKRKRILSITNKIFEGFTGKKPYYLSLDVGGTNSRIHVKFHKGESFVVRKFKCRTWEKFSAKVGMILDCIEESSKGIKCSYICLSIGAPVDDSKRYIQMYNWNPQDNLIDSDYFRVVRGYRVLLLNDLESCCFGLLHILKGNKEVDGKTRFKQIFKNDFLQKKIDLEGSILVIAQGTGLGIGMLRKLRTQNLLKETYEVIPSELSSLSAFASSKEDSEMLLSIQNNLYKQKYPLMITQLASSKGFIPLYRHYSKKESWEEIKQEGEKLSSDEIWGQKKLEIIGEIVRRAKTEEEEYENEKKTLMSVYKNIMKIAQSLCIGFPSINTIIFCGDNQVSNRPWFVKHRSELEESFFHHQRGNLWLSNVGGWCQTEDMNINILGCWYYIGREITREREMKKYAVPVKIKDI